MQPSASADIKQIAVFDYDGTCVDGQSGSLFTAYLFTHGMMKFPRAMRLLWWGARYTFRTGKTRPASLCSARLAR